MRLVKVVTIMLKIKDLILDRESLRLGKEIGAKERVKVRCGLMKMGIKVIEQSIHQIISEILKLCSHKSMKSNYKTQISKSTGLRSLQCHPKAKNNNLLSH